MEAMASKLSYENATKALQVIRNFLAGVSTSACLIHITSKLSFIPLPDAQDDFSVWRQLG